MAAIELLATRLETSAGMRRLVGDVRLPDGGLREIFFGVDLDAAWMLHDAGDPFVPALLVPAMAQGVDLRLRPRVSSRMLEQLETAQDILARFHGFRRALVSAEPRAGGENGPATAAHFSGGVDSSFTLLRSLQGAIRGTRPAAYLLFFKGLEQPLHTLQDVRASIEAVAAVARLTGTKLVVVETNLRDVFDPNYERYYCGAALASASLALASGIGTVLVPSSQDYGWLEPWGSHPMLDVLWSSERQRIVFAGAESRRVDKIEALVREWPEALGWLRVCLSNRGGGTNCGRCRKCARTMAALAALGALERATLFPPRLSPTTLRALGSDDESLVQEVAELAHRVAPESSVTTAVDRVLARMRRRAAVKTLFENTPLLAPLVERVRRAKRAVQRASDAGLLRRLRGLRTLREVFARHGVAGALRWAWARRSRVHDSLLFFGLTDPRPLPRPARSETRLASREDVERLCASGALEANACERLDSGDACLLQHADGALVGWAWLSTRAEIDLIPGWVLTIPPEAGYVYDTWTVPAARGQGLQPQRTLALFQECRRRGRQRLLCFVHPTNISSLKGVRKTGYVPIARLRLVTAPGRERARLRVASPSWRGLGVSRAAVATTIGQWPIGEAS